MRTLTILIVLSCCWWHTQAQSYFPIKVNKQWGLMDTNGKIFIEPIYDAIGAFKKYGYAVIQREGGVGLLNIQGQEIVNPLYDDIKVLDSTLVAVMHQKEWMVINLDGTIILEKGYQRVRLWNDGFLAYMRNDKWGIVDARTGNSIANPIYEAIEYLDEGYFCPKNGDKKGLISLDGIIILEPNYEEVEIYNEDLFFYRQNRLWGAVNQSGMPCITPSFNAYTKISDHFIKLRQKDQYFLFSSPAQRIITDTEFENFYSFATNFALTKKNNQLGLIDTTGQIILPNLYDEIHFFNQDRFRVNVAGNWGIVALGGKIITPYRYDYIAPLKGNVSIVKQSRSFGLLNFKGEAIISPVYTRIRVEENQAKAYKDEALSLFYFDEEGQVSDENNFKKHLTIRIGKNERRRVVRNGWNLDGDLLRLENFEWFYARNLDKWGLRCIEDGSIQIEPTYDWIQIEYDKGFTIVGIEKQSYYTIDRTDFRYEMAYGLVNNEVGMLTTLVNIWDIKMEDFAKGMPVARCVFDNGRHGLISKIGKIIKKDFAYIGDFQNGLARASAKGKLSGQTSRSSHNLEPIQAFLSNQMAPHRMTDYTQYDQAFYNDGFLTCEQCRWGYIDTTGNMAINPIYDFARTFVNEVGIVSANNKWGAVGTDAQELIPCQYDYVDFLENTNNQILHVGVDKQRYGLIDSLGQVTISSSYDMIGAFSDNRLAVQKEGKWGFVNKNGTEIIPCIYTKVRNFTNGYAAVRKGRKWGIINKNGDTMIPFEHNHLGNVYDNLIWFHGASGKGYMDINGKIVIKPIYQRVHDFEHGVARIMLDGQWTLIDTKGDYVIPPKFTAIEPFNAYGLAVVRFGYDNIRYGLINTKGKLLTNKAYRKIEAFSEGFAVVNHKGLFGYINTKGKMVIDNTYGKAAPFSEGRAAVHLDGNCTYIDTLGNTVSDFVFSKCLDFEDHKAVVYQGMRKAGLIDYDGNVLIEPSLDRLIDFQEGRGLVRDNDYRFYYITEQAHSYEGYYENASEFNNGVAVVQIDGKWGVINQRGIEIVPPKYDKIEQFEDGYARVRVARFSGLTNLQGDLIVQPDYEYISYAGGGLFRVEQDDKIGYFDMEGNWIWGLQK